MRVRGQSIPSQYRRKPREMILQIQQQVSHDLSIEQTGTPLQGLLGPQYREHQRTIACAVKNN